MRRKSFDEMECGIAQALERIGGLWSLLILRDALFGVKTFDGFNQSLGIPRNTLTSSLNHMVENGLLSRKPDPDDGRRVIYQLDDAGRALWPVLVALSQWGNEWTYGEKNGPPSYVADKSSGKPVAPIEVFGANGKALSPDQVTMILGPSGTEKLAKRFAAALGQ